MVYRTFDISRNFGRSKTMNTIREFLRSSYGITRDIDDSVAKDLREYWFPSIPSGNLPAVITSRNSVLLWLRASSDPQSIPMGISTTPVNPFTPDLSGTPNTVAASLFTGSPVTIAAYARKYHETQELEIPANFADALLDFLTDRQDVNGEVVEYITPYVRAVIPLLPGTQGGLNGDPPIINREYLLGAILQGSSENVYEVLKELDTDVLPFYFIAFATTNMVRDLLHRFEGNEYLPLLLEAVTYLPLGTFFDCIDDIVQTSDGSNYTAGRAYSLGDITRLWCLRSTSKQLNTRVNSDYEYYSGTFKQTSRVYQYYVDTLQ